MRKLLVFFTGMMLFLQQGYGQTVRYVTQNGAGSKDGSSWQNASDDLQDMINQSLPGDMVWVAEGIYVPIRRGDNPFGPPMPGDRYNSFVLHDDVKVYGGFPNPNGGGNPDTTWNGRDWQLHSTVLDGLQICYHVVVFAGVMDAALDGFIVTEGEADGQGWMWVNGQQILDNTGGGIVVHSAFSISLENLDVEANHGDEAGGIYMHSTPFCTMLNVTIQTNYANEGGAGLHTIFSSPVLNNVMIHNNTILPFGITSSAAGMYIDNNSSPTLNNVEIFCNANQNAGNIFSAGGVYITNNSTPMLGIVKIHGNINHGSTMFSAGGIYIDNASPVLDHVEIYNNSNLGGNASSAGGMYSYNASPTLNVVKIYNNNNHYHYPNNTSSAGGIYIGNSFVTWQDVEIYDNSNHGNSISSAGGIYIDNSSLTSAWGNMMIYNNSCYDQNNFISVGNTSSAAGMYIYQSSTAMDYVKIFNNNNYRNDTSSVGGMYMYNASPTLRPTVEIYNNASHGDNKYSAGGLFIDMLSSPALHFTKIYNNENHGNNTESSAGGVYINNNSSPALILQTSVYGNTNHGTNTISSAGGVCIDNHSFPTLDNLMVYNNTNTGLGAISSAGGMYINASLPTSDHLMVYNNNNHSNSNNSAGGIFFDNKSDSKWFYNTSVYNNNCHVGNLFSAGGIYIFSSDPELVNTWIYNNLANGAGANGGGIYVCDLSYPTFINALIYNNHAPNGGISDGGGVSISNRAYPTFINMTLADNFSPNSNGIYSDPISQYHFYNCIIWDAIPANTPAFFDYCLAMGMYPPGVSGNTNLDGTTNIPDFVNPSIYDYHLLPTSPCIDAGNNNFLIPPYTNPYPNTSIVIDLDGSPRIQNGIVDMGAYELFSTRSSDSKNKKNMAEHTEKTILELETTENTRSLSVYPNPTMEGGLTTVYLGKNSLYYEKQVDVKVYAMDGRLVYSKNFSNGNIQTNFSNLTSGVYRLTLQTEDGDYFTQKLVVIK